MNYLPLLYVLSGTTIVLLLKYTDNLLVEGNDGKWRSFQHPVLQTALMFFGQIICFIVYKSVYFLLNRRGDGSEIENFITRGGREFSLKVLILPAFLDCIGSVLLFTGLYLTYASSFQMIRGVGLIFTGLFSTIYLNHSLITRHWSAMVIIICGILMVISNDTNRIAYDTSSLVHYDANSIITGDLMIICAEILHAAQSTIEEKHVKNSDIPPMQAVGLEGIVGLCFTLVVGICTNFAPTKMPLNNNSNNVFDDISDIMTQLRSNPWLSVALVAFVITSAIYKYTGVSIVKFSSTSNRKLADGVEVLLIWWMALLLQWEYFDFLSILAYIVIELGVVAYRNAIFLEWYRSMMARFQRSRYEGLGIVPSSQPSNNPDVNVPSSRPADAII